MDVGYGQLDWKLRSDARVVSLERHNARNLSPDWFAHPPAFASMDVSFISIGLILPALQRVVEDGGEIVSLVKPQFEAGRDQVGKHGVVRDADVHVAVLRRALGQARACDLSPRGLDFSPITGPQGNIEFLMYLAKKGESAWPEEMDQTRAQRCVEAAHHQLRAAD